MNSGRIESIVSEYLANKEQADRLTLRNAELAEEMQTLATFAPGSETGRLEACGYRVSVTKRINEKWDQNQLMQVREAFTDVLFFTLFRQEFKPDRRALKVFMHGHNDTKLKVMLMRACTTSAGKPSIRLERLGAAQ